MKLLILMSDTGGGHRSAAEAVAATLIDLRPDTKVELLDFFTCCAPFPVNRSGSVYTFMVAHAAGVWGAGFHLTNGRRRAHLIGRMISAFAGEAVRDRLAAFQPDALLCVHPLATRLAADVRQVAAPHLPLAVTVTDLVSAHALWFTPDADILTAPSDAVQRRAVSAGVPAAKVRVTGQPIHPRFVGAEEDACTVRATLGLDPDRFTVLLLGGGEGMGRIGDLALAIDAAALPVQQVVICGRNETLRRRLARRRWRTPTRVLGFVDDMPRWMQGASVVVTKAGPSTICEALVSGRPILLTGYVPGQEAGNVDFVVDAGAGLLTPTPERLVEALRQLVGPDSRSRQQMATNALRLARPEASSNIARLLLQLVYD
jgi:1,2-diacylglycerol 3-beta-galactosyltransferase